MMAYYAILGDTTSKDLVQCAKFLSGPGVAKANLKLPSMTNIVELFVEDAHSLWSAIDSTWGTGDPAVDLNATYKLNTANDDIEAR